MILIVDYQNLSDDVFVSIKSKLFDIYYQETDDNN